MTHQGIAFDTDENLIDGQHRLKAIAEAGKPVTIMVTTGVPKDAIVSVDTGMSRSVRDHARILGKGSMYTDPHVISFIKILLLTNAIIPAKKYSAENVIAMMDKYKNVCEEAYLVSSVSLIRSAQFLCAAVSAIVCGEKRDTVYDFVHKVSGHNTSFGGDVNDAMVIRCINYYNNNKNVTSGVNIPLNREQKENYENFIRCYIRNKKSISRKLDTYPVTEEMLLNYK